MRTPRENELHARLADLADSAGSWPDPLPAVLERARHEQPATEPARRRRVRWMALSAAAATVVLLGALVWIVNPFGGADEPANTASAPTREEATAQDQAEGVPDAGAGAAAPEAPLPSCGVVPAQSGPVADVVTLTLDAPSTGTSGESVEVESRLQATADAPSLSTGLPLPDVVIVRDGRIVGRFDGAVPLIALSIPVTAGMDVPVQEAAPAAGDGPPQVTLSGCTPAEPPPGQPDQPGPPERPALPPGDYQLVAMLDYSVDTGDPGNPEAASGTLVSESVPITVEP